MIALPADSWVRTIVSRDEVGSTNDLARTLCNSGAALPLLVTATRQLAGRGRGSHRWWSDSGSLTLTLALDPAVHHLRDDHGPRLALVGALAAIAAAEQLIPPGLLGVRWPNDIETGGRKLGGILPERVDTPDGPRLLLGIGLNVTTDLDQAPDEVRRLATSLDRLGARATTPESFAVALMAELGPLIARLAADDPRLAARWATLDTLKGVRVRVALGDEIVEGLGAGIDGRGGLCLTNPAGARTLFGGQVLRD